MSFLDENKVLLAAVGIALSSAGAGFVISRVLNRRSLSYGPFKVNSADSPVTKYVVAHGIREPLPLTKLRQVGNEYGSILAYVTPTNQ